MPNHSLETKLIVFDMDGTLIAGRFIFQLARRFGFEVSLDSIMSSDIPEHEKTRAIATLLKGITVPEAIEIFDRIPLSPGAEVTVRELKKAGHVLAIISDSYTIATERLKERLGLDYTIANKLVVKGESFTGEVEILLNWPSGKSGCLKHSTCKLNALLGLSQQTGIPLGRTVAVGDNIADICMLKQAGLGIAYNPKAPAVARSADITITGELSGILPNITGQKVP